MGLSEVIFVSELSRPADASAGSRDAQQCAVNRCTQRVITMPIPNLTPPGARHRGVLTAVIAAMTCGSASAPAQGPRWEKELTENLPPALARLEQFYSQIRCRAVVMEKPGGVPKERVYDYEFAINGDRVRVVRHYRSEPSSPQLIGATAAWVVNPSLSFSLDKPPGHNDYAVTWVGGRDSTQDAKSQRKDLDAVLQDLAAPYGLWGLKFSRLLTHPTFRVRSIEEVNQDGVAGLRVHYEVHPSPSDKNDTFAGWPDTIEGWIVVLPKLGWAIQAYQQRYYDSKNPNDPSKWPKWQSVNGQAWYEGEQDGVPLLKRTESRILDDGMPRDFEFWRITEYSDLRYGPTPESEFTPEAFGVVLATPTGSGRIRVYVWLGLAALLALVAAVFLRALARRRRDRSREMGG